MSDSYPTGYVVHDHEWFYVPEDPGGLFRVLRRGDRRSQAARWRPACGENLEQRGGLPLCGRLTLVFKGQSTTIGKSTTLMQSQAARWRIVSPMPHASSSRYQAAAGRWPGRHIRSPGE